MIPKFRFWHIAKEKMHDVLSVHLMTGMVEVESGKYFLISQEGFLMQSTGLKDKNGKEIFEGDIVKLRYTVTSDEELFVVKRFRGGSWRIDNRRRGCELWLRNENCEVVGNIHENLELVEVE